MPTAYLKPPVVSSSGAPGACATPSRVSHSTAITLRISVCVSAAPARITTIVCIDDLREIVELILTAHDKPLGPLIIVHSIDGHDRPHTVSARLQVDDSQEFVGLNAA